MTSQSTGQSLIDTHLLGTQSLSPSHGENISVDSRRLLGSFYTPDKLAIVLAEWALECDEGHVLDPSFGACAFLNAATKVLSERGVPDPGRLVFGVDVDPRCLKYVHSSGNLEKENCIVRDFLTLSPDEIPGTPFRAVLGNPPYLRHHWFNGNAREAGREAICSAGVELSETASAWAYFLIHALSFLAEDGRLAMLVPEAILQADYAAPVRNILASNFAQVLLVYIHDRMFEGTDEAVVAVIASGFGKSGNLRVEAVEQIEDLASILSSPECGPAAPYLTTEKGRCIDAAPAEILGELGHHADVSKLAELAEVKIGLVTGANKHFIRNIENLEQLGVPRETWIKIVSRTRWLTGLDFTREELEELVNSGERAVLVRPEAELEDNPNVLRWIREGTNAGIQERYKCANRDPWFRIALRPAPDAFATCTRMGPPLLVLNRANALCTNAIHALYWHHKDDSLPSAVAVGFLTSAVRLWSELHGRRYGGGVLKMEPSTLGHVPVPLAKGVKPTFEELNLLIREGREDDARAIADDFVLRDALGLSKKDIGRLQQAGERLMFLRRPARRVDGRG